MRGIFTVGVLDVLMENELTFPACVGVSAGAAFGCNLKSHQPGRALRYNLKYCREPRYCSFRSLLKTGDIFGAEFCYHKIPEELDVFDVETYDSDPMAFYAVCSDVETGKPYYKKLEKAGSECYEWIRASASMPLVSRVVELDGRKFLDGGVTDSIPLRFMEQYYAKNIVVLTRPRDYVKQPESLLWLQRRKLKRYPNLIQATENRHLMYNGQREHVFSREKEGKALVICPPAPLEIKRMDHRAEMIQKTYDLGRQTAEAQLKDIKDFIGNDH